jgi:hypothetical protein
VAGFDRRVERAPSEHRQPVVEALGDRAGGQRAQAARGELQRERQPVEPAADRRHRLLLPRRGPPAGPRRGGALLEQLAGGGRVERRNDDDRLAGHAERPPARDEHADARPRRGEVERHAAEPRHQVLAAVEDEQRLDLPQPLAQHGERVAVAVADAPQAQRRGRGRHDVVAAAQRLELD